MNIICFQKEENGKVLYEQLEAVKKELSQAALTSQEAIYAKQVEVGSLQTKFDKVLSFTSYRQKLNLFAINCSCSVAGWWLTKFIVL